MANYLRLRISSLISKFTIFIGIISKLGSFLGSTNLFGIRVDEIRVLIKKVAYATFSFRPCELRSMLRHASHRVDRAEMCFLWLME